jgi:hypothetical protein
MHLKRKINGYLIMTVQLLQVKVGRVLPLHCDPNPFATEKRVAALRSGEVPS